MDEQMPCPACGSTHTFLGPERWICLDCGNAWPCDKGSEGYYTPDDLRSWITSGWVDVPPSTQTAAPKIGLPPVDEPHPVRERLEEPVEYRATSKQMMWEMGVHQTLSMRITTMNFLHELTDWRIEERRWKQETAMQKMIDSLRKEAEDGYV